MRPQPLWRGPRALGSRGQTASRTRRIRRLCVPLTVVTPDRPPVGIASRTELRSGAPLGAYARAPTCAEPTAHFCGYDAVLEPSVRSARVAGRSTQRRPRPCAVCGLSVTAVRDFGRTTLQHKPRPGPSPRRRSPTPLATSGWAAKRRTSQACPKRIHATSPRPGFLGRPGDDRRHLRRDHDGVVTSKRPPRGPADAIPPANEARGPPRNRRIVDKATQNNEKNDASSNGEDGT